MHAAQALRLNRTLVAAIWLASGSLLLLLTPLPAHTTALGWAPLLWLVGAPLIILLILQPRLPMRLLTALLMAWPVRTRRVWQ